MNKDDKRKLPRAEPDDNSEYWRHTWRRLPEDIVSINRPTEDMAVGILLLKEYGEWDDERYLAL